MAGLLDFLGMNSGGGGLLGLNFGGQQQPMNIMPQQQQADMMPQGIDPRMFAALVRPQQPGMFDNPLVHLGLGMAGGSTASEGIGGALKGLQGYQQQDQQRQHQALQSYIALKQLEDKPAFGQVGEDAFGNKNFGFINAPQQKVTPYIPGTAVSGGNAGVPMGGSDFLAKGVTAINHELKGDEYLNQYSPEVQAAVKSYVGGESMPTGNPRKGFTQTIKMISQKYGDDIGLPTSDTEYAARRTMRNDLSKTTPGSMGGQITFARTSLSHLAEVAKAAEDLNNVDTGFTPLSGGINYLRSLTTSQAAKVAALQDAAQHYGQEVTKFYAGSPGGESERQRFMTALSGAKTPTELAAVIAQEKALIPERLNEIQNRIAGTLGPAASKYPVLSPESTGALTKIDASVARMKGLQPPAAPVPETSPAASPAPAPVSSKAAFDALPSGAIFIAPDGTKRRKP